VQGVLGGLRVTLLKDEIGIFHACLAQAFLALLVIIAVASSRIWEKVAGMAVPPESARRVARAAIITTGLVYLQLALGATMRHQHRDLSILDFPLAYGQIVPDVSAQTIARINAWREARALSDVTAFQIWLQMAHRIGAVLVAAGAVTTFVIAMRDNRRLPRALMRSCAISVCLVFTQVLLGACTIWSNKAADIATAHVAVGATMLAFGVAISALALQIGRPEERSICANPSAPLEQIPVA
jgi:cytochrome c oxidase assembly protein subunit 15